MNDRFVDTYCEGFVLKCGDGHWCRLFLHIIMYLADYPEKQVHTIYPLSNNAKRIPKVLLSMIMKNGDHPCPRCLVKKVDTIKMGTALDMHK
jgi:hypothetical protein